MSTPAQQLSDFVHGLGYADIPEEVRAAAINCLVDTVGVALASQSMPYARVVSELVLELGGVGESTVIGSGARVPAPNAIIANGNMAHGIEFDNTHGESRAHLGACIVPTALAVAEKVGAGGEALIEAMVAGLEAQARIGSAASGQFHLRGFHPTFVSGCFATALSAGKLLGLSPAQLTNALGICGTQASGTFEWLEDGSWAKRFGPGWAGHGGTIAALLAGRGYTGPATIFEGRFGLYRSHVGEGNYSPERLTQGLGTEWETSLLITKRYPSCHATHAFINAARTLRREHRLSPGEIEDVECVIQRQQVPVVCEPQAGKRVPMNSYQAEFSIYYTVALALLYGSVSMEDFAGDRIRDPEVLALAQRVRYTAYEPAPFDPAYPGTVVVRLRDGRQVSQSYRDQVDNPMTDADVAEKFRRNARRSLPPEQVERLLSTLLDVPSASDIGKLMGLTAVP